MSLLDAFRRRSFAREFKRLTPEDLQVLQKALDEKPEYFRFLLELRDRRRKQFEILPRLKTEGDVFQYGLQCFGLGRELAVLNRLIEMPITAQKALVQLQTQAEKPDAPQEMPWDEPELPEED